MRCAVALYALGLELTDVGFDYSILSEFRDRLLSGDAQELAVTPLLDACKARGCCGQGASNAPTRPCAGAIRHLNRLELVGETLAATCTSCSSALRLGGRAAAGWLRDALEHPL